MFDFIFIAHLPLHPCSLSPSSNSTEKLYNFVVCNLKMTVNSEICFHLKNSTLYVHNEIISTCGQNSFFKSVTLWIWFLLKDNFFNTGIPIRLIPSIDSILLPPQYMLMRKPDVGDFFENSWSLVKIWIREKVPIHKVLTLHSLMNGQTVLTSW